MPVKCWSVRWDTDGMIPKHSWRLLERYPRVDRSRCLKCGCIRTRTNLMDGSWPVTRYNANGFMYRVAPDCLPVTTKEAA